MGGNEFLAYDQFSITEGDRESLRAPFEVSADEELDVSEQLDATGYGPTPAAGADDELDDTIEADEIPEHEGLVAAYFREMLRYSILSPEEERSLGRIIKEGQDNILNLVSVAQSDLEEIRYLQKKLQQWYQTPDKSAQGKEKLFKVIHQRLCQVRTEHKNLYRYICQLVGNVDDAMEVVQETFLVFYRLQENEPTCKCDQAGPCFFT